MIALSQFNSLSKDEAAGLLASLSQEPARSIFDAQGFSVTP